MMPRKSKGRQKVEMVRMAKDSNRQVTFSKRRTGLFKKASELSTLCGVEIAIVVFSPGKKVFSFGHPSVDSIVDRYFSRTTQSYSSGAMQLMEAHRNATVQELNSELTRVSNQLEKERKRGEHLTSMMKARPSEWWWESPVDQLEKPQLEQLKASLEDLKKKMTEQANKILNSFNNNNVVGLFQQSSDPRHHDPEEFEQKNVLGFTLHPPTMNINNSNMNNLNMSLMLPPPPPHFNSFGRGLF